MPKIYLIGLDSDPTFCHFAEFATERGITIEIINLRSIIATGDWQINLPIDDLSWLDDGTTKYKLDPSASYYCRIINLASVQTDLTLAHRWLGLLTGLTAYLEQIPGIVINSPNCRNDNGSKPLHELALQYYGLKVPPSITSSDRSKLTQFTQQYQKAIVKAISGIRADSRLISLKELDNFHSTQGPIHLQQYISGDDVRVHVVGDKYQAELIQCPTVDYRLDSDLAEHFPHHQLPPELAQRLINATKAFGLVFAGWDFKRTPAGEYWCLEANPMPGYDVYDRRCDGKVSELLLELLQLGHKSAPTISANPNPHQLLTTEQCAEIYQKIRSLRQDWIPRGNEDSLFCTLGAAIYLDCGSDADPQNTYWQKASRYNAVLFKNFGWLYSLVKTYLETQLNAPINYRTDAAYPGFHIWLDKGIPTLPLASIHFDLQYQHLTWENLDDLDLSNTFSFTLPIQLPASGGGLNLYDLNYFEYVDICELNQIDWHLTPRFREQSYHAYRIGEIVMHSGHTMHQVAPTSIVRSGDRRVTLQGHGVCVDGTWQIYW
jgi:glutathione synthase/RimK-type ligase-like ATP-grasp enzyme